MQKIGLWLRFALFTVPYVYISYMFFAIGYNRDVWGSTIIIPIVTISVFIWGVIKFVKCLRCDD